MANSEARQNRWDFREEREHWEEAGWAVQR